MDPVGIVRPSPTHRRRQRIAVLMRPTISATSTTNRGPAWAATSLQSAATRGTLIAANPTVQMPSSCSFSSFCFVPQSLPQKTGLSLSFKLCSSRLHERCGLGTTSRSAVVQPYLDSVTQRGVQDCRRCTHLPNGTHEWSAPHCTDCLELNLSHSKVCE